MKKYICDVCGEEIPEGKRCQVELTAWNDDEESGDEMDYDGEEYHLCSKDYQRFTKVMKENIKLEPRPV
jgi:hypothetical protein